MAYWKTTLAKAYGVTHAVYKNHGVRVLFACRSGSSERDAEVEWENISRVTHGEFEYPTCLWCIVRPLTWRKLLDTQQWMAERAEAEALLAGS